MTNNRTALPQLFLNQLVQDKRENMSKKTKKAACRIFAARIKFLFMGLNRNV